MSAAFRFRSSDVARARCSRSFRASSAERRAAIGSRSKFRLVVQASNMTHPLGQATVASSRLGPVTSLGPVETAAVPFPTGAALCEADTGPSNFAARLQRATQRYGFAAGSLDRLLVRSTMWSRDPTARPGNRIEDGYRADPRCAVAD